MCWNEPEGSEGDTQLSPSLHRPPRVRESSKLCSGGAVFKREAFSKSHLQ